MGLRVLHVMPSFWPATRYGGPIKSVLRLCQALQHEGVELEVVTTDADGPGDLDVPLSSRTDARGVPIRYFPRRPRTRYTFSAPLAGFLAKEIRRWDLIHVAALFSFSSAAAMALCRLERVPYVVSPHGSLLPWAFGSKRWKKMPYFELVERANVAHADGVQATSDAEEAEIQRIVPSARTFVVPNGVDIPDTIPALSRDEKKIVFLGRIHAVKGFDVLIPALSRVAAVMPEAETIVAGPDEEGEWARVAAMIDRASPKPRVRWIGEVQGQEKLALLASSAALVLPSHGENFGMVVAEALACGTPVVVSKNCPWRIVEERGAGAWVDNTPEQIAEALLALLRDPARARRMGEVGPSIAARFRWSTVAQQMIAHYEGSILRAKERKAGWR